MIRQSLYPTAPDNPINLKLIKILAVCRPAIETVKKRHFQHQSIPAIDAVYNSNLKCGPMNACLAQSIFAALAAIIARLTSPFVDHSSYHFEYILVEFVDDRGSH